MTPPLPKQIREAAEKAATKYEAQDPRNPSRWIDFLNGVTWLYSHLAGLAEKGFDERAADAEYSTFSSIHPAWSEKNGWLEGARWQHAQTQALIALRDAEIAELELQLSSAQAELEQRKELAQTEIAELKRQLGYPTSPGGK